MPLRSQHCSSSQLRGINLAVQRLQARIGYKCWEVVDVQVDFTGLAIIRSSPDRVRQCTPKDSGALTSLDPRWGRSIRALAMSSLNNSSSKPKDLLWPGWARPRRPWLIGSQQHSRARDACWRQLGRLDRAEVRTAT